MAGIIDARTLAIVILLHFLVDSKSSSKTEVKSTIVTTVLKSQMRKPSAELKHHAIQINKGSLARKSLVDTKSSSPHGGSVLMPPIPIVSDSRNEKTSGKSMANNTI